ncbi:hypothetical protein Ahy_A08g039008 [Arachis hypogaea]|uniref:DUF8040 domain-containing protein n=1 Tax=Arachis hypogaea TaxID=3818 RepID=A0A445BVB9_ARAHY|nr:hypothetical protein Ahy_A08g039008 [Arachis hypogaea]
MRIHHIQLKTLRRQCGCTGVPVLERKKSMCCNNFHIVIFSGCHLTTAVVFSQGGMVYYSQHVYTVATMSGYSSAVKLEIEKCDGRINFGLWQIQVKDVFAQGVEGEDKKYPHGIAALPWIRISCGNRVHNCTQALVGIEIQELCRWLKNFQEKPIWKLHHEFSARFRSVPRQNAWSGLIPSEYTFMVEYDSSLNYDRRYRQWQQRIVGCTGVPVLERKKSMCCNNFHIVIFSGCHLTTAVQLGNGMTLRNEIGLVGGKYSESTPIYQLHGFISNGSQIEDETCIENTRMDRCAFHALCNMLKRVGRLEPSRNMDVEEMIAMFLHIIAHDVKIRVINRQFVRSKETISRRFNDVLLAILRCHNLLLKKPQPFSQDRMDER